jgi:hypothetical protein
MKLFFAKVKIFTLGILCLSSALQASCPLVCTGPTGAARFCNLTVTGALLAGTVCVSGNEQVGGNLTVCGTTTSFVSGIAGGGLTGPISFATLAAFGFAWNPALVQTGIAAGANVPVTLTNSSSLFNTTFAPSALTPQVSGTYLIDYIVDLSSGTGQPGTFSIAVAGTPVPGSQFTVTAGLTGAVTGQALVSVTAGQPVTINFNNTGTVAALLAGTASLTLERVGN